LAVHGCHYPNPIRQEPIKIPTPSELTEQIAAADAPGIEACVRIITDALRKDFRPGGAVVSLSTPAEFKGLSYVGKKEVCHRFDVAGWTVTQHDDQREGASLSVTAKNRA
jgi:hypothetical protein